MTYNVFSGTLNPTQSVSQSIKPRDWLDERLRSDLFCVEWDVKLTLSQFLHP